MYFCVLAAQALSLTPREDWTSINLIHTFHVQDGVESGADSFEFSTFRCKDSFYFVAGKIAFYAFSLVERDCLLKAEKLP